MDLFHDYDLDRLETEILGELPGVRRKIGSVMLDQHLDFLRNDFIGQPVLLYYHAFLTVHIRRRMHDDAALDRFKWIWREKKPFLLRNMGVKWLRSSLDTVVDTDFPDAEKNLAMAGILLLNTVKLYETERRGAFHLKKPFQGLRNNNELFNGLQIFAKSHGDMVFNTVFRLTQKISSEYWTKDVVLEILRRLHRYDTVYRRVSEVHTLEKTRWKHLL